MLASSWWSTPRCDSPIPVDPFRLARELGIRIRFAALPTGESGNITISPDDGPAMKLNRGDSRNRQRFTCSHEIGHYQRVEHGLNERRVYVDRRAQLASAGLDADEIYANQFAAALLMPAHLEQARWLRRRRSATCSGPRRRWRGDCAEVLEAAYFLALHERAGDPDKHPRRATMCFALDFALRLLASVLLLAIAVVVAWKSLSPLPWS